MRQEIAKSPEILEKEALIKELQSQLTKRKSILKGLKTRLENNKNQITDIQPLVPMLQRGLPIFYAEEGFGIIIGGNPLSSPTPDVVQQGRKAVLDFFKK